MQHCFCGPLASLHLRQYRQTPEPSRRFQPTPPPIMAPNTLQSATAEASCVTIDLSTKAHTKELRVHMDGAAASCYETCENAMKAGQLSPWRLIRAGQNATARTNAVTSTARRRTIRHRPLSKATAFHLPVLDPLSHTTQASGYFGEQICQSTGNSCEVRQLMQSPLV